MSVAQVDRAAYVTAARVLLIVLGCAALAWGASVLPGFWRQASMERTAARIVAGDPFKPGVLVDLAPVLEATEKSAYCRPSALRSAAIVRLRLAEQAVASGDRQLVDAQMTSAHDSIRNALSCSPADPFLWLALFGVESTQRGFSAEQLEYIRMSYRLGPHEGWVALRRNHISFALFEQLPSNLAEAAIGEFVALLEAGLYRQAVEIFTGPAWPVRDLILPRLKDVAQRDRRRFADALHGRGYDVAVPGVDRSAQPRPWH